eukprot:scaffold61816_cov54-Attheya_sp.AAC.4
MMGTGSSSSSHILELTGAKGTGKTAVCTWLVARYVVATSDSNYSTLRHEDLRLLDHESPSPSSSPTPSPSTSILSDKQAQGTTGDLDHHPPIASQKEHSSDTEPNETDEESSAKMQPPPLRQHYGIVKGTTWVPRVVIFDADHGMHIFSLVNAVRVAVLHRVRDTVPLRASTAATAATTANVDSNDNNEHDDSDLEWRFIETEITKCLGRIHLVYPQNGHDFVPALESLRHSLDQAQEVHSSSSTTTTNDDPLITRQDDDSRQSKQKKRKRWQEDEEERVLPPTLLVMDSLSAFQHVDRMQENLPTANTTTNTTTATATTTANANVNHNANVNSTSNAGAAAATGRTTTTTTTGGASSGLSGRNELVRQLQRLLARHSSTIVVATTTNTTSHHDSSNSNSSSSSWNKIVTHRLTLDKVARHSREEADGYDFVALVPNKPATTLPNYNHNHNNTSSHNIKHSSTPCDVIPFSITSHGIRTQS